MLNAKCDVMMFVTMGFYAKSDDGLYAKSDDGLQPICDDFVYIAYVISIVWCYCLMLLFMTVVLISDVLACDDFVVTEVYVLL